MKQRNANSKVLTWLIVVALIVIGLSIILILNEHATGLIVGNEAPLEIGVFTPLSGDAAIYGDAMKKGLDLAAQEVNQDGGVLGREVRLVYSDTYLDSKEAVSAVKKFIEVDGIDFIIAAEGSGATSAAVPLADSSETIMMIPIASTPTLKDAGDYVFRIIASDAYQGRKIAEIAESLNKKSAGILYLNDAYGFGVKNTFKQEFDGRVIEESFNQGDSDFKTQLTKIKNKDPDVVVIVARTDAPNIIKQIHELGIDVQIIASAEFKDESLVKATGDLAEGIILPFYTETTDYVDYKEKFEEKYDEEPALFSDYGYDSLMVVVDAIEAGRSFETLEVKERLYDTAHYGATGIVKFDYFGERTDNKFVAYRIENGVFVEIGV